MSSAFDLNGAANALSISPAGDCVVAAGREVLKILKVDLQDSGRVEITELLNLRSGSRLNLNLSCSDVKWAPSYAKQDLIATAATNGSVVIWDINKPLGQKQDRLLTDHTRAVNRLTFHPTDPVLLLTASQDGTMRMWDLRVQNSVTVFEGKSESVRDVQFAPHSAFEYAAAFENGNIQKWDIRMPKMYEKKLSAHSGLVLAIDWHPDGRYLASGGRDKVIKFWDMSSDARKPIHAIQTISSLARIQWRPRSNASIVSSPPMNVFDQTHHVASCSLLGDNRIHCWNLERPYLPDTCFEDHDNVVTGICWRDSEYLWSVSKDRQFVVRKFSSGFHPGDSMSPVNSSWNVFDDIGIVERISMIDVASGANSLETLDINSSQVSVLAGDELTTPSLPTAPSAVDVSVADEEPGRSSVTSYFTRRAPRRTPVTSNSPRTLRKKDLRLNLYDPSKHQATKLHVTGLFDIATFVHYAENMRFPLNDMDMAESTIVDICNHNASVAEESITDRSGVQMWKTLSFMLSRNILMTEARQDPHSPWSNIEGLISQAMVSYDGNVQMSVLLYLTFRQFVRSPPQQILEEWFFTYIDMLKRLQLFTEAAKVTKYAPLDNINRPSQESTTIHTACHRCYRPLAALESTTSATATTAPSSAHKYWYCERCKENLNPCVICQLPVKTMYAWCRECSHGGHLEHLRDWFKRNDDCPACGLKVR
eukprot:Partr_v1_DN28451_c2_g1_i4_m42155 putative WD repeat domain 24